MNIDPKPEPIRLTREDGGIALVVLSRPPVNALNWELKRSLVAILDEVEGDQSIRAVVFASDLPKVFCAGSDLYELSQDHDRPGSATERTHFEFDMWQKLSSLMKPTIAAVEGHALGSGCELAVACDFRVAGSAAMFGLPEIKIGGAPGIQTLTRLPRMIGIAGARRMLLTGDSLPAEEAYRVGLVDKVVPAGEARSRASALGRRVGALPQSSMHYLKTSLSASMQADLERVQVANLSEAEELFLAPQMREGIRAFLEKREPDFDAAVAADREAARR